MNENFSTVADALDHYKAQLSDLTAKVSALEADKATAEKLMAEADARANDLDARLKAAGEIIAKADGTVSELTAKLTAAETAKAEAEKAHAKLKEDVSRNPAFADASAGRAPVKEPDNASGKSMSISEFKALSPKEQAALARGGVTLSD